MSDDSRRPTPTGRSGRSDREEHESAGSILSPRPSLAPAEVERASESVMSVREYDATGRPIVRESQPDGRINTIGAVSSGRIEIPPDSLSIPPPETPSIVPAPASSVFSLDGRRAMTPLSTIVGIGAAILAVLVGLSLLLFR